MHRSPLKLISAFALTLVLAACSTPQGDGGPPPRGGSPAGTPHGLLVAAGTGYIHTFTLLTGTEWSERLSYAAPWSTVAVIDSRNELLIANTSGAEPVSVEVYDIDTFGLKGAFEWPDSTSMTTLYALAATRGGDYLAITMSALGPGFLEIIETATGSIVYTGLDIAAGSNFVWTPDDDLIVAVNLSYEDNPDRWGAIVSFPLANLLASTDGAVEGTLLATFTRAEWDVGVNGLALSADGSELVFERASDLWVMDLVPDAPQHQLTTGPTNNHGAVFSPSGTHIAFASGGRYGLDETYVIPNHRTAPLFIDYLQDAGNEFLLEADTLVDYSLAWLP
ncbi:MAG TPA: hypothetical protein VKZ43_05380 [Trueperaceae bacterium]|nr:hypothetical protein [Trueperaceae bacterium]